MKLFKKDTKGKIRYLSVYTNGPDLVQESGIVGTDSPVIHTKTCKSKNVGRSNQTSPEEQAQLEMTSLLASKESEGYFNSVEEAQNGNVILPMLAKDYKVESKKIDWSKPVFIQPKLDGMRCLAFVKNGSVTLMSRDGKIIKNMDHIIRSLESINTDVILDGELYCHGKSFQENMELIKKYRKGETESIQFHIYDLVEDKPFSQRVVRPYVEITLNTVGVPTYEIKNEDELKEFHSQFLQDGYEGSIIRHGDEPYKVSGRSSSLLKYKDFQDLALPILDIEPADKRPEWGVPVFYWKGAKDDKLRAGMKFSHEKRMDFLKNKDKYIGVTAELRFFEYSDEGVPRFPVCVGFRLDK